MLHRGQTRFALLLFVASPAFAALDPASHCQAKKLKAAAVAASELLRCHAQAVAAGSAVSANCMTAAEQRLVAALGRADAKGGCLTTGDAAQVHGALTAAVSGIATMLRPDTSASICTSTKLFHTGRAAARLLKASAKQRKKPDEARFFHATADFRQDLAETFAELERASSDCRTLGDGGAVAERVLALSGDATLRLWPLSQSGLTLTPPPGFSALGTLFAMSNGNVLMFSNYGRSQMVPPGSALITVSRLPLPTGPLSEYIERESHDHLLSTTSIVVGGHTGTRVMYRDDYDAGISVTVTAVLVPHGSFLYRFSLEPPEGDFVSTFDALLSSVTFVP